VRQRARRRGPRAGRARQDVRPAPDAVVVATRDGVVVGAPAAAALRHPDEGVRDPFRLTLEGGLATPVELAYPLVGCDGAPLDPGPYDLLAAIVVTDGDGADPREVVALPLPVTVG
jgi:hypothetical protein